MIPDGTRGQIVPAPDSISGNSRNYCGEIAIKVEDDLTGLNMFVQTSGYPRTIKIPVRDFMVLTNPSTATILNGTVSVGDWVAFPDEGSSNLVVGKIAGISKVRNPRAERGAFGPGSLVNRITVIDIAGEVKRTIKLNQTVVTQEVQ